MSDNNSKYSFSPEAIEEIFYKGRVLTDRLEEHVCALMQQSHLIKEDVCYFKLLFQHPDLFAEGGGFRDNQNVVKGDKKGEHNHEDHH